MLKNKHPSTYGYMKTKIYVENIFLIKLVSKSLKYSSYKKISKNVNYGVFTKTVQTIFLRKGLTRRVYFIKVSKSMLFYWLSTYQKKNLLDPLF